MKFARIVFVAAGIWGLLVLAPFYFRFDAIGQATPPPITHPEFYYGFLGVALAWQIAFLVIGMDPVRFRPMMLVAVVEKLSYWISMIALYMQGRLAYGDFLLGGVVDLILAILFVIGFVKTSPTALHR
jgi:hypothetical protein